MKTTFGFATFGEAKKALAIITAALADGWTISVNDGEEWTVKQSTDRAAICDAMNTTEYDILRFRKGELKGDATLIWGNDPDGSELVADYTCSCTEFETFIEAFV